MTVLGDAVGEPDNPAIDLALWRNPGAVRALRCGADGFFLYRLAGDELPVPRPRRHHRVLRRRPTLRRPAAAARPLHRIPRRLRRRGRRFPATWPETRRRQVRKPAAPPIARAAALCTHSFTRRLRGRPTGGVAFTRRSGRMITWNLPARLNQAAPADRGRRITILPLEYEPDFAGGGSGPGGPTPWQWLAFRTSDIAGTAEVDAVIHPPDWCRTHPRPSRRQRRPAFRAEVGRVARHHENQRSIRGDSRPFWANFLSLDRTLNPAAAHRPAGAPRLRTPRHEECHRGFTLHFPAGTAPGFTAISNPPSALCC